jgi:hypothetical protein
MMRASFTHRRGYLTIFVLIFASVFMTILAGTVEYLVSEKGLQETEAFGSAAFAAADAGLQYSLWHLGVWPGDLSAVSDHAVVDAAGNSISSFSLSVSSASACGTRTSVDVMSTGVASSAPAFPVTLEAIYAAPTLFASSSPDLSSAPPDFSALKNAADSYGVSLPYSGAYGYSIVFNPDGSFDASPVTGVRTVWGYSAHDGWKQEHSVISSTGSAARYTVSSGCPVVFVADNAWVSGTVGNDTKVTLAAANIGSTTPANIYLPGNLTYGESDGDGIVLVAQGSALITLDSPDILTLRGGFIAAGGAFGRNEYLSEGAHAVPSDLSSDVLRSSVSVMGGGIGAYGTTTKWTDENGAFVSGYASRSDAADRMLVSAPPALTPVATTTLRIVRWKQD